MTPAEAQRQLELFDLTLQPNSRPRTQTLGRLAISLRYDQLVLAGIAGLIGVTVVFAGGVERGKQLVRAEYLLAHQESQAPSSPATSASSRSEETQAQPSAPVTQTKSKSVPVPTPARKRSEPSKLVSEPGSQLVAELPSTSRYAVQVVSYRRPQLAQQEMEHLHSTGERAFLILREGYTVVYVGPFPSKMNAREKLAQLKARYQGCFIKTL